MLTFLMFLVDPGIMNQSEVECMLKSCYAAGRLNDVVLGLKPAWKTLVEGRGWENLLNEGSISTPNGLVE